MQNIVSFTRDVSACCDGCSTSAILHVEVLSKEQDCENVIYELDFWVVCDGVECPHTVVTATFSCNTPDCQTFVVGSGSCCLLEVTLGNHPDCTCDPCVPVECEGCQRPISLEICDMIFDPITLVQLAPPNDNTYCWGWEELGLPDCCDPPVIGCPFPSYWTWGIGVCCEFDPGDGSETYNIVVTIICYDPGMEIGSVVASGSCSFNMDCLEFGCKTCAINVTDTALPTPNILCTLLARICKSA